MVVCSQDLINLIMHVLAIDLLVNDHDYVLHTYNIMQHYFNLMCAMIDLAIQKFASMISGRFL